MGHQTTKKLRRNRRVDPQRSSNSVLLEALGPLLQQLAELMIEVGANAVDFLDAMTKAFVTIAEEKSRLRNLRTNRSAVAAMTGLARGEVDRILKSLAISRSQSSVLMARPAGVGRVVAAWLSDSEFVDAQGRPRKLRRGKGPSTFDSLVNRYGPDVPAAAILREMNRRGLLKISGRNIGLQKGRHIAPVVSHLRDLSAVLATILKNTAPIGQGSQSISRYGAEIKIPDQISKKLLRKHLATAIPVFFDQAVVAAGGQIKARAERPSGRLRFDIEILISERAER